MSKTYVMSDPHFGHDMLVGRGYRPKGFEELIFDNVTRVLQPGDRLIILGDLEFGKRGQSFLRHFLSAQKRYGVRLALVRGNHDHRSNAAYMDIGFDWSCDGMRVKLDGKEVLLTHLPAPFTEPKTFDLNIHGHLHAIKCGGDNHRGTKPAVGRVLISMELLQYMPIDLLSVVRMGVTPMYRGGKFMPFSCYCDMCKEAA